MSLQPCRPAFTAIYGIVYGCWRSGVTSNSMLWSLHSCCAVPGVTQTHRNLEAEKRPKWKKYWEMKLCEAWLGTVRCSSLPGVNELYSGWSICYYTNSLKGVPLRGTQGHELAYQSMHIWLEARGTAAYIVRSEELEICPRMISTQWYQTRSLPFLCLPRSWCMKRDIAWARKYKLHSTRAEAQVHVVCFTRNNMIRCTSHECS